MSLSQNRLSRRNFLLSSGLVMGTLLSACTLPPVAAPNAATASPTTEATAVSPTVESTGATRPFTHTLGVSEVPVAPQRIIALHNEAIANNLLQLGVVPLASVNEPPFVTIGDVTFPATVVSVGGYQEPSLEQIAALKPDLIISSATVHDDIYEQLSAIAPTVPVFDIGATDALATPRTIADLVGKTAELDAQIRAYEERVAAIREQLDPVLATLEVSIFGVYGDVIITTRHPGWTCAQVMRDLGIQLSKGLLENSTEDSFSSISLEDVPKLDGDVIFIIEPVAADVEALRKTGILDLTFAGKAGQIFTVDDGPWYRGGLVGLNLVLDDIEAYLLNRELDTSGDFR